ncbi:unnamed protein product, partial [Didymodactylos carnosus]
CTAYPGLCGPHAVCVNYACVCEPNYLGNFGDIYGGPYDKVVGCVYACFNGNDHVTLINGQHKQIEDLHVGDRIYTINVYKNKIEEDVIMMMAHTEPEKTG